MNSINYFSNCNDDDEFSEDEREFGKKNKRKQCDESENKKKKENNSCLSITKFQEKITGFCYEEQTVYKILVDIDMKIKKILDKFPYTYINNSKFKGILNEGRLTVHWNINIIFHSVLQKKENNNQISERSHSIYLKNKYGTRFCPVSSKIKENRDILGITYFPIVDIQRSFTRCLIRDEEEEEETEEENLDDYLPNFSDLKIDDWLPDFSKLKLN
jgi:hypothetical protein